MRAPCLHVCGSIEHFPTISESTFQPTWLVSRLLNLAVKQRLERSTIPQADLRMLMGTACRCWQAAWGLEESDTIRWMP